MQKFLRTCEGWAQHHFGTVDLGDCRRGRRLVKVAAALAACPSGTLPGAFPVWSELKAAYRLLDASALTFEKALAPHCQKARAACSVPGQYLLIEDTTSLDFTSHRSLKGMGRIGDDHGQGLYLHTTLAFAVEGWDEQERVRLSLVGLAGQHRWVRGPELTRGEGVRDGYEPKKRKFLRARESERWARVLTEFPAAAPENQRIYIADREGDMYELFERCEAARCDFVVRGRHDRALLDAPGRLFATMGKQSELGRYNLELRTRPGAPARSATMALRAAAVVLRPPYRPGRQPAPRALNVVQAREVDAPEGRAIEWFILTNLPCDTAEQARQIVGFYACRWIIEEYHKALKTGAGIEKSQLEERARVEALLGILSLVALRLLDLKLQAAESPTQPLEPDEIEPASLRILAARFEAPPEGWTKRSLWISIARLGGYLARKSDGPPGWQTLWRGWDRLRQMTEGANLITHTCG